MSGTIVTAIEIRKDPRLGLLVVVDDPLGTNKFIHRDASGIRWDEDLCAFRAFEPTRWKPSELMAAIRAAAVRELGIEIRTDTSTQWHEDTLDLAQVFD